MEVSVEMKKANKHAYERLASKLSMEIRIPAGARSCDHNPHWVDVYSSLRKEAPRNPNESFGLRPFEVDWMIKLVEMVGHCLLIGIF